MTRVLIVDDDPVHLRLAVEMTRDAGHTTVTASGGDEALKRLRADPDIAAVLLDLVMPDRDGMAVLEAMARDRIAVPVIVMTTTAAPETIASATRAGATDFLTKPIAPERLIVSLNNALRMARLEVAVRHAGAHQSGAHSAASIVTSGPAMHRPLELIRKAARTAFPVLVEGEAGTGKDLVARIIHATSERAAKPFLTLDLGALPLAGHDPALFGPDGALVRANGGTLLLRGIGELSADAQGRLLRVLESGEIAAGGAARPQRVNVRLIVATPRRLLALAQAGELREDLFFRLNVLPIYLPPLRDRRDDIARLAEHFAVRATAELGRRVDSVAPDALTLLSRHDWPGNVRELDAAIFRAVALATGPALGANDFPHILAAISGRVAAREALAATPLASAPVHIDAAISAQRRRRDDAEANDRFVDRQGEIAALAAVERDLIAFALERCNGQMSRVARSLGIGRSTLYRKLKEYGLADDVADRAA